MNKIRTTTRTVERTSVAVHMLTTPAPRVRYNFAINGEYVERWYHNVSQHSISRLIKVMNNIDPGEVMVLVCPIVSLPAAWISWNRWYH